MRTRKRFALKGLFTFFVVLGSALLFRSNQEKRIFGVLDTLLRETQIAAVEPPLERISKVKAAAKHFCPHVQLALVYPGKGEEKITGRQELERMILASKTQFDSLTIVLGNRRVTVEGDKAKVTGHATITGSMPGAEGKFLEEHDVEAALELSDGEWLLCSVHGTSTREQE